jgi:hypothetical protein
MPSKSSAARDRVEVGAFFGLVAGLVALVVVVSWTSLASSEGKESLGVVAALHAGHIVLYVLAGGLLGYLWPRRRTTAGRWGLWLIATATGAVSVNSVTYGPFWSWSPTGWGYYSLMAILFTPVFAWPAARKQPG